jgi:hypothetical protein
MKSLLCLLLLTTLAAFQANDKALFGIYIFDAKRKIELKKDHTFMETKGDDWRNGMWKLSHDTLVLQEGMLHTANPRQPLASYTPFFLYRQGVVYAGRDAFKRAVTK